ncbi:hypothetical protein GIB67_031500 [Kingdonia uniflora]|uniref:Uncharacterized protein n=1 Tax=Kingdonia uniflora TaxID=39325 RepID=A0A7J7MN56_9MAGN|nr:hypothetical protein GIB67_031500 [Kingdonia uniflora]
MVDASCLCNYSSFPLRRKTSSLNWFEFLSCKRCPFCKTSSYAVEYNGARSQKERILERAEEQKVIEAKIRMQLQESQNTYPMTPAEQNLSSVAVLSPVSRSRQLCETRDDDPPVLRHLESGVEPEEFMLMKATRQSVQDSSLQKSTAVQLSPGFQSETSYETFIREDQNRMGSTPSRDIDMHEAGSSRYSEDTDFDWPRSETDFLARYSTTEEDSWELLSACILEGKQSSDNGLIFDEDMVSSSVDTTPDVSSASQHYSDKYEHLSSSHIPCPASNGIH